MNDYHCHRKFSKWKMINSIWRSTYTRTRLPKKKNTHVRGKQMFTISSLKKKNVYDIYKKNTNQMKLTKMSFI